MAAAASAVLAAAGTAVWALSLSGESYDGLRYALVSAGGLVLLSLLAVPPKEQPTIASLGLGALLAGYQGALYMAVAFGGAAMQAIVNLNIILICLYRHLYAEPTENPGALLLGAVAAASSAAVLAVHRY
jgi:hypothetical protein